MEHFVNQNVIFSLDFSFSVNGVYFDSVGGESNDEPEGAGAVYDARGF